MGRNDVAICFYGHDIDVSREKKQSSCNKKLWSRHQLQETREKVVATRVITARY